MLRVFSVRSVSSRLSRGRRNIFFVAALGWIFSCVVLTGAQFPTSAGPTADRAQSDSDRDLEQRMANMRYLISAAEKRGPARKKDPKLALAELQEDFPQIQILNKDLVLKTDKSDRVDLKFVTRSAAEIHKHAEGLIGNLALPELPAPPEPQKINTISDGAQLKKAITTMGWLIYWFTKNPMFKDARVIEAVSAEKARRDLDNILAISTQIRLASERLQKQ